MIIKFAANELNFELTTDSGDPIIDVAVGDYKVEIHTEDLPTIQKEMLAVVQQFVANAAKFKAE